ENKMSDGGRGRASLGVKVWKSSQSWNVQRSDVRSIAWLGASARQLVRPYELLFETGRTRQRIVRLEAICATDSAAERAPQNDTIGNEVCDEIGNGARDPLVLARLRQVFVAAKMPVRDLAEVNRGLVAVI